ncbi:MAG: hypothetical protein CVU48_06770 [Candidatus Cloacimonetes bacterium HGW-Cloacimonetes-1]|jgi:hypothetical protein|nr:MAG: hypothetical protein CVU48_06770 [Candidatus Cloacimonetes bacterium HGW-Cloacimonetes-1]
MQKIFKRLLAAGGLVFFSYQGYRSWRLIRSVMALDKALPGYLESIYGELPKVSCNVNANVSVKTRIVVKFSAEIIAKYDNIEEVVKQFISDFYPVLAKSKLKVAVLDIALSKAETIKQLHPKIYEKLGSVIEKKLKEKETTAVYDEPPTD